LVVRQRSPIDVADARLMFWRRVSASAHNCALIIVVSLPVLLFGKEAYRYALIGTCFTYHLVCRRHCLGNFVAGLRNEPPTSVLYCALYTAGFATIVFSIWVPFDILAMYVLGQLVCLRVTGSTIPGYLTGYRPCVPSAT